MVKFVSSESQSKFFLDPTIRRLRRLRLNLELNLELDLQDLVLISTSVTKKSLALISLSLRKISDLRFERKFYLAFYQVRPEHQAHDCF